ncbi:MAG: prolyl oligopeptidase family serine peptidase [Alphaproteobacteria bacterium]
MNIKLIILLLVLPIFFVIPYFLLRDVAPDAQLASSDPFLKKLLTDASDHASGKNSPSAKVYKDYSSEHYKSASADSSDLSAIDLEYMIQAPAKPWPENLKFPLIIHLSDTDSPSYSAAYHNTYKIKFPAFSIAPKLPKDFLWGYHRTTTQQHSLHAVLKLAEDIVREYPIDTQRIYIVGCGHGATGALSALDKRPDLFAAAIAHSPDWDQNKTTNISKTPILIMTGDSNITYPTIETQKLVKNIEETGGNISYKEIQYMKHDCAYKSLYSKKIWAWLFAQKRK